MTNKERAATLRHELDHVAHPPRSEIARIAEAELVLYNYQQVKALRLFAVVTAARVSASMPTYRSPSRYCVNEPMSSV